MNATPLPAEEPKLPDKLYFKIGEVAKIVGVPPYVLRYWETEFREIGPSKSRSNQRLYRRKDVEALLSIKQLLYREGFTIAGAKKRVRELLKAHAEKVEKEESQPDQIGLPFGEEKMRQKMLVICSELKEIVQQLRS